MFKLKVSSTRNAFGHRDFTDVVFHIEKLSKCKQNTKVLLNILNSAIGNKIIALVNENGMKKNYGRVNS